MDRRSVLLGAGAGIPFVRVSQGATTTGTFAIEAPDDVVVISIAPDGPVKKGDPLLSLKSFNLERMEIQLALFTEHIAILERPFIDGRVDAEIALVKAKMDALADRLKQKQDLALYYEHAMNMNLASPDQKLTSMADADAANSEYMAAKLESDQVERKKADALDRISLARSKLAQHRRLFEEMSAQLAVASPFDARFAGKSLKGLFAKKGRVLAEIIL
jgi:hypothetical protein